MANDYEGLSLDVVAMALGFVSAHDRETWVRMAMAMKSEFGEAGFDTWDAWSATADSYKNNAALAVWKSVKAGGKTTIGTLIHEAMANGFKFEKPELTEEQKQDQKKEIEKRRRQRDEENRKQEALTKAWHERIASISQALLSEHIKPIGSSPYLGEKKVQAFGIGFFRQGVIIEINEPAQAARLIFGADQIREFFNHLDYDEYKESGKWFLHAKQGTIAVPLRDEKGKAYNLQLIFSGGKKQFIKNGRKSGCFHIIGEVDPSGWLLVVEGYATGASVHMATGDPVAVAFDAGNLLSVSKHLRGLYPDAQILICGDNDTETENNPGKRKAQKAADAVNGRWWVPDFSEVNL